MNPEQEIETKSCAAYLDESIIYIFSNKGINSMDILSSSLPSFKIKVNGDKTLIGNYILECLNNSSIIEVDFKNKEHKKAFDEMTKLALKNVKITSNLRLMKNWVKFCRIDLNSEWITFNPYRNLLSNRGFTGIENSEIRISNTSSPQVMAETLYQAFEKCINYENS